MNPFELDVYERLLDAGLRVDTQYGVAGYRLDFAVRHPHHPGQHVLAVETDGATYHSGWTARERDRLRQQHLESLGWRFHRIWSTDYWRDPEAEIADVVSSVQTAVDRLADGLPPADEPPIPETTRPAWPIPNSGASRGRPAPAWVSPGRAISAYTDQQLVRAGALAAQRRETAAARRRDRAAHACPRVHPPRREHRRPSRAGPTTGRAQLSPDECNWDIALRQRGAGVGGLIR